MGSLGYVMTVPEEEKYLMSQSELEARLVMLLAGRAAEEIVFDSVTQVLQMIWKRQQRLQNQ